jgi:hypothetical protein
MKQLTRQGPSASRNAAKFLPQPLFFAVTGGFCRTAFRVCLQRRLVEMRRTPLSGFDLG